MRQIGSTSRRAVAVALAVLTLTACATATHGSPQRASAVAEGGTPTVTGGTEPDVTTSERAPHAPATLTVDDYHQRVLESLRIANEMPLVSSVDETLVVHQEPITPMVSSFPDYPVMFSNSQVDLIESSGYIAGFVATRHNPEGDVSLSLGVLEFESADRAAAVAPLLPFDQYADPLASEAPGAVASEWVTDEGRTVSVAAAVGPLVYYSQIWTAPGIDGLPLAEKGLATLTEGLAEFRPSTAAVRSNLPADPDGVVSHTVADPKAMNQLAWLNAHGALHLSSDPVREAATFDIAGVDIVTVFGLTQVYRAADPPRALLLGADAIARIAAFDNAARPADLPDLPEGVNCLFHDFGRYNCVGTLGRYAYMFMANSPEEVIEIAVEQKSLLELIP